jgi:hypothetical protein
VKKSGRLWEQRLLDISVILVVLADADCAVSRNVRTERLECLEDVYVHHEDER